MKPERIEQLARETAAGIEATARSQTVTKGPEPSLEQRRAQWLNQLVSLALQIAREAAEGEREACAKIADRLADPLCEAYVRFAAPAEAAGTALMIAAAIRARTGEGKP